MASTTSPYSVIYAFGDSLSDAGDAYLLTNSAAASTLGLSPEPVSPPYYAASYPAPGGGTLSASLFSNGPVWVQDLAASLGIAVPGPGPVGLSTPLGYQTVAGGAAGGTDFAIGGSVTGASGENTGVQVAATDLAAQITNFQGAVPKPAATALYTVWSGSNDLLNLLDAPNFAALSANGTAAADVTASVNNEIKAVQSLVADGAQSVLVLNVPDLGMIPAVTAGGAAAETAASALASSFDSQLKAGLGAANLGTATVKLEDTYSLIDGAIENPQEYGLLNVTGSVYTGSFTADSPPPAVTGAAQNQYLFFDKMHPTETGQAAIANEALAVLGVACFAAGTRIATPDGEVGVERLAAGDRVLTAAGVAEPVRWIGRRSYAGRFLAGQHHLLPIVFAAGSLGSGLPRRALRVSPLHAMLLDGVLVPAGLLVNGGTIRQEHGCREIDYIHVELAGHDVILAEGAPSETFLDDGSRGMFHNAADAGHAPAAGGFCAPRVESGFALEAIRRRLAPAAGETAAAA